MIGSLDNLLQRNAACATAVDILQLFLYRLHEKNDLHNIMGRIHKNAI